LAYGEIKGASAVFVIGHTVFSLSIC
jgi:hypothetical protein